MLILGVVLLIIGFILSIKILWIIGVILAVVGLVLLLMAAVGGADRRVGGRRYWY